MTVGGYTIIKKIEGTSKIITDRLQSAIQIPELPIIKMSPKFEKAASKSGNFVSKSADVFEKIAKYGQVSTIKTLAEH